MNFLDLFEKVIEKVSVYIDKNDKSRIYAQYPGPNEETCFSPIHSMKFKGFLHCESLKFNDEGIDINNALKHIELSIAYYGDAIKTYVHIRVAGDLEDGLEYDLQNCDQTSVKVNANGWEISERKRKFLVPKESLEQAKPIQTNKSPLELLKKYFNLSGDNFKLFVVWLIHCFCYSTHIGLVLMAAPGSGKTTISKMAQALIDPSDIGVMRFPDKKEDLCLILGQSYFDCFDNAVTLSKEESDILCGAITGTASVKRALYTDSGLCVVRLHNTIMINGIDVIPEESDLADRLLVLKAERISSKSRLTDKELKKSFDKELPEILGSIFNTLSAAMSFIDDVDRSDLPRMAEAYINMVAIAKALGIEESDFRRIFSANKLAIDKARSVKPIVEAIVEYMNRCDVGRKVEGFVEEIFKKVKSNYSGSGTAVAGSASVFSKRLKEESATLAAAGITVNFDDTGAKGTKIEIIKK